MSSILRFIKNLPEGILVLLMSIVMLDMMALVFSRYALRHAFFWAEEIGSYGLIWITFIGSAVAVKRKAHFSMPLFTERLTPSSRQILDILLSALILVVAIILIVTGSILTRMGLASESPALNIPMYYVNMGAPIGGVLIAIYAIMEIVNGVRLLIKK